MWEQNIVERRRRMRAVIEQLEGTFSSHRTHPIQDPFSLLIATILSQNTSDTNSLRAFQNLKSMYEVTPMVLAGLQPNDIQPLIKVAGLYEIRSKRIIEIAKIIQEKYHGNLDKILQLPIRDARKKLMSLEGVGSKTADILLAFICRHPVMPVDTNIFRVSERIGLAEGRNYLRTQRALEQVIPKDKIAEMHFSLIRLGREICKPRKPLCYRCPIQAFCDFLDKTKDDLKPRSKNLLQ